MADAENTPPTPEPAPSAPSAASNRLNSMVGQWQQKLLTSVNAVASSQGNNAALKDQVRQELGIAWGFVRTQLGPTIVHYVQVAVDRLDPPAAKAWQWVQGRSQQIPALGRLRNAPLVQKSVTALLGMGRSAGKVVSPLVATWTMPEILKPVVAKRAGLTALLALVLVLLLIKPSRHGQAIAKPVPRGSNPTAVVVAPPVVRDYLPSEQGDVAINPDQIQVVDIQSQVAEVSQKYGEALIQSVQTNFRKGRLIVELSDAWYQLDPLQQDRLMTDLWRRSQSLNFKKLFATDPQQQIVARSPVTGSEMVILKR
ncbi:MAG: hypothetical protein HC919_06175 [Oscillatoriales cyanobacterium SM2_2_1]|nr:hypothetical protein [Oscillatoriales cyanobacterium SM2_2_1]